MIRVTNISKTYGKKQVLDRFSAQIEEGQTIAVMGKSGGGKTTLLRILMGLETADSGTVEGISSRKMSAVFQEDRLCENLSVMANIRLVNPSCPKERILEEMKKIDLYGCENQPVRELSGGMKRRTALLRALLATYDILFLDEPFKGLDETTREKTARYARESSRGRTVILVTHDRKEARWMEVQKVFTLDSENNRRQKEGKKDAGCGESVRI